MLRAVMSESIAKNLSVVKEKIKVACTKRSPEHQGFEPRLVAVSKTKPKDFVIEAYQAGQRHFGENYVQELVEKANDEEVLAACPDIKWHYIGHLQRNKIGKLMSVPNLFLVETVDSKKLADSLNSSLLKRTDLTQKLNIYVQVNTSGEEAKSGCEPEEASDVFKHVIEKCNKLNVLGLMTIGRYDNYDPEEGINPDFKSLLEIRIQVAKDANKDVSDLEVSMGMSADFEHAIEVGSTNVRVGTAIFGQRNYRNLILGRNEDKTVQEDGDVKLLTTPCIVTETENIGSVIFGATIILKQFAIHQCGHTKKAVSGSHCILDMIGGTNASRYIVASQDRELQKKCRLIEGVPLLYLHMTTPTLEQPSYFTQDTAVVKSQSNITEFDQKKLEILNSTLEQPEVKKKRKRKGGPNPLSCKKKKKKVGTESDKPKKEKVNKRHRKKNRFVKKVKKELALGQVFSES